MAQEEKLSGYRWMILFVVCLICFMANFMQYQVSAWGVVVMTTLGIDAGGLTNLMLMPMLTAVFLSIPAGSLADRYGVKLVVSIGMVLSAVGGFLRYFMINDFTVQIVSMFMIGFGIAALNANLAKVLGSWFKQQTSLAVGVFYAASCVSIVIAQAFSTYFPTLDVSYLVAAIAEAVTAALWIFFMRNVPDCEPMH